MFKNISRTLEAIENTKQMQFSIETDSKGYIDKQCPSGDCEFLFKVNEQDWKELCRDDSVWCPMCGRSAPSNQWFTIAQVNHAKSAAVAVLQGQINNAMREDARQFNRRQSHKAFIRMSMSVTGGHNRMFSFPAVATEAMQLEIRCEQCSSRFAVVGVCLLLSRMWPQLSQPYVQRFAPEDSSEKGRASTSSGQHSLQPARKTMLS